MNTRSGAWSFDLPLRGPGGEPIDLARTLLSHGFAELPPMLLDEDVPALEVTLAMPRGRPRTVRIAPGRKGHALISVVGRRPGEAAQAAVINRARHIMRFDEDLSGFYATIDDNPDLSWAARGAGRMLRSGSVFEEVVKTICTTNCAWSATTRMVGAIVEHLGEPAAGAPADGPLGRAFPTPAAMARAGEDFYQHVARAGYRGRYLIEISRGVDDGSIELEILDRAHPASLDDPEVNERLLALPGVGPYAAAHIMMMLGRYRSLILDSWTRPTYARLAGFKSVKDSTIQRRFKRFGEYAGLAFWLYVTRPWVTDGRPPPE
jgi:3-methyladenine DNA glycosylase/8-oxoguanine DNA glycosylase